MSAFQNMKIFMHMKAGVLKGFVSQKFYSEKKLFYLPPILLAESLRTGTVSKSIL